MPQCTLLLTFCIFVMLTASQARAQSIAHDPGPRGGPAGAGGILPGLSTGQIDVFNSGRTDFEESETIGTGLGPRFNLDSCGGCHSQPATGGSSSAVNPQVSVATAFGARNVVPSFIRPDGPVREARFKYKADGTRDGGVHALFVVSGRVAIELDGEEFKLEKGDCLYFSGEMPHQVHSLGRQKAEVLVVIAAGRTEPG